MEAPKEEEMKKTAAINYEKFVEYSVPTIYGYDLDTFNIYLTKDGIKIGIHAIGYCEKHSFTYVDLDKNEIERTSFFHTREVWGNKYNDQNRMIGGSFRLSTTILEDVIEEYIKDGWSVCE